MDSAGVAHPVSEFLFVGFVERDPVWRPCTELTRLQIGAFDPVVDYIFANLKVFCHLMDGQLLGPFERGRRDPIAPAYPLDDLRGVSLAFGTGMPFLAELGGDLGVL